MSESRTEYTPEELEYLLRRAIQGATTMHCDIPLEEEGLSDDELDRLFSLLFDRPEHPSRSRIDKVLYYGGYRAYPHYREQLSSLLIGPDPFMASRALYLLDGWGVIRNHIAELAELVRGPSWSYWGLQCDALHCAGEYLYRNQNAELLRQIIQICEYRDEEDEAGVAACDALRRLLGSIHLPERLLIEKARDRLADDERIARGT
jgi:hypothetical protein